jgi:2-methylcitrate dehydratase PrpD
MVSPTNRKVLKYARPSTVLEAKFSMQFACACALANDEVSLQRLSAESLAASTVQRLMELVQVVCDVEQECPLAPGFAFAGRVIIKLNDGGGCDSGRIRVARRHAQLPLERAQHETKAVECVPPGERGIAAADLIIRLRPLLQTLFARPASLFHGAAHGTIHAVRCRNPTWRRAGARPAH